MITDAALIVPSGCSYSLAPVKNAMATGTARAAGLYVNVLTGFY